MFWYFEWCVILDMDLFWKQWTLIVWNHVKYLSIRFCRSMCIHINSESMESFLWVQENFGFCCECGSLRMLALVALAPRNSYEFFTCFSGSKSSRIWSVDVWILATPKYWRSRSLRIFMPENESPYQVHIEDFWNAGRLWTFHHVQGRTGYLC